MQLRRPAIALTASIAASTALVSGAWGTTATLPAQRTAAAATQSIAPNQSNTAVAIERCGEFPVLVMYHDLLSTALNISRKRGCH